MAGVVALLLQARPGLLPPDIKRLLQLTATPVLERDRSEVGAGLLDAWAAITSAVYPGRPFGTHIPGWLDQRPYSIEHLPAVESEAVLPAGSRLALPVSLLVTNPAPRLSVAGGTTQNISWTVGSASPQVTITAVSSDSPIAYSITTGGTLAPVITGAKITQRTTRDLTTCGSVALQVRGSTSSQ